ncbi:etoposide-induced protein 2.4 homolog [Sitodiplosis mosellana]|uniref:etoposide-induced protein 2.4 homolog n=1 Tax=Sitodiplosis mosellana TaxID=263140 RepID=UPI00244537EF|nr:etoposide-induced protein 2.4 homolog [Sitodiplosis mosellana]
MDPLNSILKAYLRGVWDSLNGVWLIVIVIRDTYSSTALKNEKQDSELDESSSSSNNTHTSKRPTRRSHANKRELNKLKEESNLLKRVFQCCLLNGGFFGLSITLFEYVLLPIIRMFLRWMFTQNPGSGAIIGNYIVTFLSILFGMIWVMPLFILSKIVNSLWFQDIADSAYKVRKGQPQLFVSFSVIIADTLFSLLVQTLFLIQSMVVNLLPFNYFYFLTYFHLSLLYSLYSFEYKWCNMGWELHKRLTYIENHWPYFLGFGTILTILTQLTSSIFISGCIFAVFFPFSILSANEATPVEASINYPLKFFSIVVAISNALFNKTIRPANVPMSRAAMDAAITAANANDTFRTIRQQTPPVNVSHSRNQSSHHSGTHRHYR